MLVLTRQVGQKIIIAKDITVEVVEIKRGKVRLGITAPEEIPVRRQEISNKGSEQCQ